MISTKKHKKTAPKIDLIQAFFAKIGFFLEKNAFLRAKKRIDDDVVDMQKSARLGRFFGNLGF